MYYGTVGIVLWSEDYSELKNEIEIKPSSIMAIETPDETYYALYWDWVDLNEITNRVYSLIENIRHSFISISEDGKIIQDFKIEDERGCDEEFDYLLSWYGGIEINGNKML